MIVLNVTPGRDREAAAEDGGWPEEHAGGDAGEGGGGAAAEAGEAGETAAGGCEKSAQEEDQD